MKITVGVVGDPSSTVECPTLNDAFQVLFGDEAPESGLLMRHVPDSVYLKIKDGDAELIQDGRDLGLMVLRQPC